MSKQHCISRHIDNSRPCNGWWGSMLRRVRNCRFIIYYLLLLQNHRHRRRKVMIVLLKYCSQNDDDNNNDDGCADCSKRVVQPDGTTTCYSPVFASGSWSVARLQCASRGPTSRLVGVSSTEQNDAIKALLRENGLSSSWLAASETVHAWQWLDSTSFARLTFDTPV